jgi:[protein-PII] uridylyltransferase
VGRVHHDVYHVYTVDVHSVAAVDRLRALARGDLAEEHALACRLAAEISRPVVLYLATLLHDVGKAIGGKDHAIRGADMAVTIGERLGLDAGDVDQIQHLVRTHLLMYHVATRRDLDDPQAILEFLRDVRGRENLRELYLLTVADLSTTSPTAMTSWKARLLDELYRAADRQLAGSAAPSYDEAHALAVEEAVLARVDAGATADARRFLRSMPERYLLANAPDAIAAHLEVAKRAEGGEPAVALRPLPHGDVSELCVVAPDRPGLLAQITAAIVAARLEVHAAQIHSHPAFGGGEEAVDLFWVRGPGVDSRQVPHTLRMLERDLGAMMRGERTAQTILEGRGRGAFSSRPTPAVETQVSIDDRAVAGQGIIEVLTRDRAGVLHTLAQTLHDLGLSISLAKINTEGTRVADVFYVTDATGSHAPIGARADEIRASILGALDSPGQT